MQIGEGENHREVRWVGGMARKFQEWLGKEVKNWICQLNGVVPFKLVPSGCNTRSYLFTPHLELFLIITSSACEVHCSTFPDAKCVTFRDVFMDVYRNKSRGDKLGEQGGYCNRRTRSGDINGSADRAMWDSALFCYNIHLPGQKLCFSHLTFTPQMPQFVNVWCDW